MQMTNEEIRRRHKEGATVQILADLNAVTSSTIKSILENKPIPATPAKKYEHRSAEYKKLYDEGKVDSEIGELMGTRASNVWAWRNKNKLPSNVAPKRKEKKVVEPMVIKSPVVEVKQSLEPNEVCFGGKLFYDYDADSSNLINPNPTVPDFIAKHLPYIYSIDLSSGSDYSVISEWLIKDGVKTLKSCTILKQ